ncbi:hypothetical protein LHFGNBLO_002517 [Mesorhizobium sp. AR10]|uniref:hypothetical protein n=1 Tax=Mesorhizobium sp. AR10 TaxID=2865839 RepID=UPI00215DDECE|nr:hypothetical protein [Mesorhizobium sp. AR10]UVK40977.1 hypothetical protein LHFGNBLO_002517 [Mesorhizobium sp. AR10]
MKRAIHIDSASQSPFDATPIRVRRSEARAAAWSPFRHRIKATDDDLLGKGPPCAF